jgi:hypothetical protein
VVSRRRPGPKPQPRLPIDPLLEVAERMWAPHSGQPVGPVGKLTSLLGIDRGSVWRAAREGVTIYTADQWAVRLGYHPSQLWPDLFYADLTDGAA